jgi:photosystem II oxygen-evolving enhancer protein 3
MAHVTNLNGVTETLPAIPKLINVQKPQRRMKITGLLGKKPVNLQGNSFQTTRRLALGLASIALIGNPSTGVSLAEDNWWARDIPLPVPSAENSKLSYKHHIRMLSFSFSRIKNVARV